jgi:hypothetical protein
MSKDKYFSVFWSKIQHRNVLPGIPYLRSLLKAIFRY